jgi:tetratricopeptide (TPR) repeat protein
LEGLAYRLMPYKVKGANDGFINTKIMTENMMKKFHWRELDNPKVYYYETYFQMTAGLRNAFAKLGLALLDEGKKEEAKKVALFCLEKIPDKAIPYDYYTPRLAGVLLQVGEEKKALEIINTMVKRADEDLEFYLENRPSQVQIIQTQIQILSFCLNILQEAGKKDDFLRIRKIFDKHYSQIKQ